MSETREQFIRRVRAACQSRPFGSNLLAMVEVKDLIVLLDTVEQHELELVRQSR